MLETVPEPVSAVLEAVFRRAMVIHPALTESALLEHVVASWLESYQLNRSKFTRAGARLRNNLEGVLKVSGRSRGRVAEEVGISRDYLRRVVNEECEPSLKIGLH